MDAARAPRSGWWRMFASAGAGALTAFALMVATLLAALSSWDERGRRLPGWLPDALLWSMAALGAVAVAMLFFRRFRPFAVGYLAAAALLLFADVGQLLRLLA